MTATKNEVIKHINKLFENQVHTPDAAGNYHDYPLQSLFTIVHGSPKKRVCRSKRIFQDETY